MGWLYSATAADAAALRDSEFADGHTLAAAVERAHVLAPDLDVISELVPGDLYSELRSCAVDADLLVLGAGYDPREPSLIAA